MDFEHFLLTLQNQNPKLFSAEKINISIKSFKSELEKAYNAGKKAGFRQGENENSLFGRIFGAK